ncbi:MAG: molybdopterin-synthase adenylyltransferase MoeB [Phyllobacteriaceae bacterium]|nr:molybdopterin-synthase adenylyltransferase MoeB [Phyllobacteriaceae bacterium]
MVESAFTSKELERYARHVVLAEIGGAGQQRLKRARVLIVGAGGLGAPAALYLAAAGVGTIGLVDDDTVALSNLQRQIIHGTPDIGRLKTQSARDALVRVNPEILVVEHPMRLTGENAASLVRGYDIVLDGSDNFVTRYALADACAAEAKPLVTAAAGRFDGSLTVLAPFSTGADGAPNPSYRDLFPEAPPPGVVPSCAEAGVIGALTGVLGALQAMEAIKLVTGAGEPLIGRLLLYDALAARFDTIAYKARPR